MKSLLLYDKGINDLKLIRYHISFKASIAVFFFLKRSEYIEDDDPAMKSREKSSGGLAGCHFMVRVTLTELNKLIQTKAPLITKNSQVSVLESLISIG